MWSFDEYIFIQISKYNDSNFYIAIKQGMRMVIAFIAYIISLDSDPFTSLHLRNNYCTIGLSFY